MNYNDHKKSCYENGNIRAEFYYLNNKYHRVDGPAKILYYENGNIKLEQYFLNNKLIYVKSSEKFKRYIKTLMLK